MKKVSVIIAAYNSEKSIGRVLDALAKQDYGDFEVIVVDDCSKDRTLEVVKGFRKFKLIRNKTNQGLSKSLNIGIRNSAGEIVITLHDDCVPMSDNWITKLVKTFDTDPKIGITSSDFVINFKNLSTIDKIFSFAYYLGEDKSLDTRIGIDDINTISDKGDACRKEVLKEVGLFNESYKFGGEDMDLSRKVKQAGYRIVRNNECKVEHIFTESGREHTLANHLRKAFITTENSFRVFLKFGMWYKVDSLLFILLLFFGLAIGQFYVVLFIGMAWLVAKNFIKSLRYYKRYNKTDLIIPIWLFCIAFDILAGFGWVFGVLDFVIDEISHL